MFESSEASLLVLNFLCERLCIQGGVTQVVARIGIVVDTDGQNVGSTFPFQAVSAIHDKFGIAALDVVVVEGIGCEAVFVRSYRYCGLQRVRTLPLRAY